MKRILGSSRSFSATVLIQFAPSDRTTVYGALNSPPALAGFPIASTKFVSGIVFSETLFGLWSHFPLAAGTRFFSRGSHGGVSLDGVAVQSLSAIIRAPRKRPRDGPRAVEVDAGSQAVRVGMSVSSLRARTVTNPY
ncbi:MAG: hypothetical protein OXC26_13185, partial [Albidovulum sp.]|nr:hypothetical protein [Albidovulum sp.]